MGLDPILLFQMLMLYTLLVLNLIIFIVSLCLRFFSVILTSKEALSIFFSRRSLLNMLLEFVFNFLALFVLFSIWNGINRAVVLPGTVYLIAQFLIIAALVPFYTYFLYFFIETRLYRRKDISGRFDNTVARKHLPRVPVYAFSEQVINAYTAGILPGTRQVLYSNKLMELLDRNEQQAVLLHELGHVAHRDLLKRYLLQVFMIFTFAICYYLLRQWSNWDEYLLVILVSGVFNGMNVVLMGMLSKRQELAADRYAWLASGNLDLIRALHKMNAASGGLLNRKAINYPTLDERIEHLQKHFRRRS